MIDELKKVALKKTRQRKLIMDAFIKMEMAMSAEDIYKTVCNNGINKSTVYRILSTLTEKGVLNKVLGNNRKTYYTLCEQTGCHHHHLICSKCNEITELPLCPLELLNKTLEEQTGYKIMSHTIELTGICSKCAH